MKGRKTSEGPACMYDRFSGLKNTCPSPSFAVKNQAGAIVSYVCAVHKLKTWDAQTHPGLTATALPKGVSHGKS